MRCDRTDYTPRRTKARCWRGVGRDSLSKVASTIPSRWVIRVWVARMCTSDIRTSTVREAVPPATAAYSTTRRRCRTTATRRRRALRETRRATRTARSVRFAPAHHGLHPADTAARWAERGTDRAEERTPQQTLISHPKPSLDSFLEWYYLDLWIDGGNQRLHLCHAVVWGKDSSNESYQASTSNTLEEEA
mgnify:CR=1 FL=1